MGTRLPKSAGEPCSGRSTVEAVERGCSLMLRGFVLTQMEMARSYWESALLFLLPVAMLGWWRTSCLKRGSSLTWYS